MTVPPDVRFANQLANFEKALLALEKSLSLPVAEPRDLSGIIKDFEIVYELCWKALKTFLEKQGHETKSAKDVFSQAYQLHYLDDQGTWLEMISDRNLTVHTYDESFAREMGQRIKTKYAPAFRTLFTIIRAHK